ncbi:MAG: TonB-dependent receptor [Bacteroidales bacterium]|nr:TonB-dependent receptor [Bacteroidales bacterium]
MLKDENVDFFVYGRQIILSPKNLGLSENQFQQVIVSGTVTDAASGDPLPGVNIVIKGTTQGVTSDMNGKYSIVITSPDAILVYSFIGYVTQEVPVSGKNTINVALVQEIKELDEVVVVGYGTQKRSDITGSVASVSKERLSNIPVTNFMHAIQGSTAGLLVTQTSSVPGSSGVMQVRGVNSINANTSPFIVLDGIPFFGSTNDINTNDIESIEILKDASAVAIYGTRGANGVILITTKRGPKSQGKPVINYHTNLGIEQMSHVLKPMSPAAYVQKYADYMEQNGMTQTMVLPNSSEVDNYNAGITTDWLDEITQPGRFQEHNISISGGTEHIQYYVSGSHLDQDGVVKGYQYKRTSFRSNLDAKITDYLKIGASGFVTNNNYDGGRVNFLNGNAMSPYSVPRDSLGNYLIYPMYPELMFVNPLLGLTVNRRDRGLNLTGNGYAEVTPGFLQGFKYRLNASYIYNITRFAQYTGREYNDLSGTATLEDSQTDTWVIENIISYTKDFGKHHIDFTGLYSAQKVEYFRGWSRATTFTNDALAYYDLAAGASQSNDSQGNIYTLASQMGRINYSYDSRYLFTVTARRDGYSAFGANTSKYGLFPSVAFGWNFANESFMKNLSAINQLKLRVSYGETGNQAIGVNQTVTIASTVKYPFGGSTQTGVLYNVLGNANLNWETTTGLNVGLDFGLFGNRISGTAEVYKTKTRDILLRRNLPAITGYNNVWANLGKMQNIGFDLTLKTVNLQTENFRWVTDLNFSTYKNEILELYGDGKDDLGNNWFIGHPLRIIYDYEKVGIWQEGEDVSQTDPIAKPGDLKFKDQNDDHKITAEDRVIIGQRDPKWIGGMTNTFTYKNFNLSIFLQTSQGGLKSNRDLTYADEAWRRNLPADFKYWTPENKSNYWPSLAAYKNYRGYQFAEDYSYLRIKDVTLSYTVPKTFLNRYKIEGLTLYISGRNLYTFTKWFGWDPEMTYYSRGWSDSSGSWENNYPPVRTVSFGLNLGL